MTDKKPTHLHLSMKNPGCIMKLNDGRRVIMYKKQPLIKQGKWVLHLVDENLNPILDEKGKQKTLLKSSDNPEGGHSIIGYVD